MMRPADLMRLLLFVFLFISTITAVVSSRVCFSVLQVVWAPGMNRLYSVWRDGRRLNEYIKTSYRSPSVTFECGFFPLSLVPRIVGDVASK